MAHIVVKPVKLEKSLWPVMIKQYIKLPSCIFYFLLSQDTSIVHVCSTLMVHVHIVMYTNIKAVSCTFSKSAIPSCVFHSPVLILEITPVNQLSSPELDYHSAWEG